MSRFFVFGLLQMAKKIDETQVRHVAKLARLDLTDDEVARFSAQLSDILGYVEKLNELDTDSVEPLAHCLPMHNVFREDDVTESLDTTLALKNAPQRFETFFKVPKILNEDSGA